MGIREPNPDQYKKIDLVRFRYGYVNAGSMLNPTHSVINWLGNGLG